MITDKQIPHDAEVGPRPGGYRANRRNAERRARKLRFWRYRTRIQRKSGVIEVME